MNIKKMSVEEIENFDWSSLSNEDKKIAIRQLSDEASIFHTLEQSNKLVLNSIYGSMANKYMYFYKKDLAEAITIQGQDAIKYSEKVIDNYFHNLFHKDTFLLSKLQEICPEINMNPQPCKKPMTVYMDTDSAYVSFEEVVERIGWTGSANDLVLCLNKHRLDEYLEKAFDKYAQFYNTESYLDFELETISRVGIWAQKKKYIQDISWEDGKVYDKNSYIKAVGLEIKRANIPSFCRPELVKLVEWIFDQGKKFTQRDLTIQLLELKKRFAIADIEDITFNTGIGNYEKYVIDDTESVILDSGTLVHIRGAAMYNHELNKNSAYDRVYTKIKTGDKAKWYYTKSQGKDTTAFAFLRGSFPKEFAPEVDIDMMFEKSIVNPINNIIKSMEGIDTLKGSLKIKRRLF